MGLSRPPSSAHSCCAAGGLAAPAPARHLALVGPTASGKTALALALARRRPETVELVSVDSMAVYVGMDVGTAKPSPAERAGVGYHLIDLADPSEDFSVSRFRVAATEAIAGIEERAGVALLVGGTGLYLRAVVDDLALPGRWPELATALDSEIEDSEIEDSEIEGSGSGTAGGRVGAGRDAQATALAALYGRLAELDPQAAARMEPTNRRRVVRALEVTLGSGRPFSSFGPGLGTYPATRFDLVGLRVGGPTLAERIDARLEAQLAAGFLDEVSDLAARPAGLSRTARQAVGYRELLAHLEAGLALDEAVDQARRRSRRLARRQRAWFGRDPRITWLEGESPAAALDELDNRLGALLASR